MLRLYSRTMYYVHHAGIAVLVQGMCVCHGYLVLGNQGVGTPYQTVIVPAYLHQLTQCVRCNSKQRRFTCFVRAQQEERPNQGD